MVSPLSAHEQPISKIFGGDYVFEIPGFQRPYAWTVEQARDLFDDLWDAAKAHDPSEDLSPYFLGSVVLIKPESTPQCQVVDGQQRLTTITLLLSAIRSNLSLAEGADITQLIYEKGSQILGTQDRFRLSLRSRDLEFFQTYVQREDGFAKLLSLGEQNSDSRQNLRKNALFFDERLKELNVQERLKLAQFVVTRCFLVVVSTPDLDSAYRIFSILNSRGLPLAPGDILKAEIVGAIEDSQRDVYTKKWEDLEESLGRNEFSELLSHVRMIYRKAKPKGTVLKEFREHVAQSYTPKKLIDAVIVPVGEVFAELTDSAYVSSERAETVNEHLRWLNRLEFNDWLPPALAFAVRHRSQPKQMESFFRDLERLAYSMLIRKSSNNDRIEKFSRLTKEIESGDDLANAKSALQLSQAEQAGTYKVLSGPLYDTLAARARSAVLLRLDALMSGGGATYDYETITVEHVLPQNPKPESKWTEWFPDAQKRLELVHSLGNLALLTRKKNASASNYEFDRKKSAYFAKGGVSPFVLTTQVLEHTEWKPDIVAARQKQLCDKLEAHWRLQNRKTA
ncbi:DUF262 domain-containing protein [Bradyrhizobium sp. IC3069]|uniref:DUF262 domain-containing protein n=1 Tax=unclassified Bradyrhizobium TaxID=2631580 RepID=UPI001CD35722|nr:MULTISPECIES: DUF262 domain-containing protein [unclassified Bradyrhizobium]MCA1358765.1 DUF262 domain-containing protein [Bradyrhizobium sp. IC4059]MCA1517862.1 DUF262 domain-containing protein [Bradyrhizobium sp. IC3069]